MGDDRHIGCSFGIFLAEDGSLDEVDAIATKRVDALIADEAMKHLGNVLMMLENLAPSHRCDAFNDALTFHNAHRPDAQIGPRDDYLSVIVTMGPLDWAGTHGFRWPENKE